MLLPEQFELILAFYRPNHRGAISLGQTWNHDVQFPRTVHTEQIELVFDMTELLAHLFLDSGLVRLASRVVQIPFRPEEIGATAGKIVAITGSDVVGAQRYQVLARGLS